MGNAYGTVRVSNFVQNEDRQIVAMQREGVPEKNVYVDKRLGKVLNNRITKRR